MSSTIKYLPTSKFRGFTLVEMLVAMAVTLLMMVALARGFGFIGDTVRESRVRVELSNSLRDITSRLRDELGRCTVSLLPAVYEDQQGGYLMYYEGPLTDATSSIFRATTSAGVQETLDSRYGDLDDYLAFTAVADGDNWFTGTVPRFVLDQKTYELAGSSYTPGADALDPIVIRSKYAEIVYFASPEYGPASLPAAPAYIDVDGDTNLGSGAAIENGFPDRVKLHRRVLLIRPDLNLNAGFIQSRLIGGVPYLLADAWPTATTATVKAAAVPADSWRYHMAAAFQQCDLSLRRVTDGNGDYASSGTIAANSLADLKFPHNRFGHVRVPGAFIGLGGNVTSMPVLSLTNSPSVFNMVAPGPTRVAPPASPAGAAEIVTPSILSGFLRPEFALGNDFTHLDNASDSWGIERLGEDVLANNLLGFDIKVYDPTAVNITSNSTGLVSNPNDAGFREALREIQSAAPRRFNQGGFVDLAYATLAGGSLRGWQPRRMTNLSTSDDPAYGTAALPTNVFNSPFSGVEDVIAGTAGCCTKSLYRSGKLVLDGSDQVRLYQPTIDTFTVGYERDGFLQSDGGAVNHGTRWTSGTAATNIDSGADGVGGDKEFAADTLTQRETSPPFLIRPEAIRVTIRIDNPSSRQIRQASVVHRDN